MGKKNVSMTDTMRREDRKKELKRNRKQRQTVRCAVLKSKDPLQLLEEATLFDKQEYDHSINSSISVNVIAQKRKRILETFDRLLELYKKEDDKYYKQLSSAKLQYEERRINMINYYEKVKLAQNVKTSDIPLPKLPDTLKSFADSSKLHTIGTKKHLLIEILQDHLQVHLHHCQIRKMKILNKYYATI
uniref:WW domain-binding protein 11 n=1 Tax=Lepeophtheirus salmonis TaxID=72036 RepID=D3PHV7_LEPSM|nr:WW domain-binding protein 11 [Lepeophtheirus salmonis]